MIYNIPYSSTCPYCSRQFSHNVENNMLKLMKRHYKISHNKNMVISKEKPPILKIHYHGNCNNQLLNILKKQQEITF